MNDCLRRDDLISIVGTIGIVGYFLLVVYSRGERACQAARREITIANPKIESAPIFIQQATMHSEKQAEQQSALLQLDRLMEDENELHKVLQQVANFAPAAWLRSIISNRWRRSCVKPIASFRTK